MLGYVGFLLIFSGTFLSTNSQFIDNISGLFKDEHCIEASLTSMSFNQEETVMLDSSGEAQVATSNVTRDNVTLASSNKNPVMLIHELAQHNGIPCDFELIKEEGPAHMKQFSVKLVLGDENYEGRGSNLRNAKTEAAKTALANTFFEIPPQKLQESKEKSPPTVVLNNVAAKLGIGVTYFLLNENEQKIESYGAVDLSYGKSKSAYDTINDTSTPLKIPAEDSQHSGPFFVKVKVGDLVFKGMGHTVQAARHDAADTALKEMERKALFKDNVCSEDESSSECREKKESLKSPVSRVNEASQQLNLPLNFKVIKETGQAHKKVFLMECRLGDLVTEAEATSKKECKQLAAKKMLELLPKSPEVYAEKTIVNSLSNKNKRKKKRKSLLKKDNTILNSVSEFAQSLFANDDDSSSQSSSDSPQTSKKTSPKPNNPSAKSKILEIGSKLNIDVQFTDLPKQDNLFLSVISLDVKPPQVCLGKASSRDGAQEVAALHGIKLLHKSGIFNKPEFMEYKAMNFEDYVQFEEIKNDIPSNFLKEKKD